jgi:hypothetical protein
MRVLFDAPPVLLVVDARGDRGDRAEPRYRMLEPIRRFAATAWPTPARSSCWGSATATTTWARWRPPSQTWWVLMGTAGGLGLRSEQDNLRAAMAFSRHQGDAEALARMVAALRWFWVTPGRWTQLAEAQGVVAGRRRPGRGASATPGGPDPQLPVPGLPVDRRGCRPRQLIMRDQRYTSGGFLGC